MSPEPIEHSTQATQEELVACMTAYQAGTLVAFERLHALLAADVERFFLATLLDRAAAQDLTQETFLELHRARRTYLPPLPVRPWVLGIARNVERRHRRQWARRRTVSLEDGTWPGAEPVTSVPAVEREDLAVALRSLPPSRREAWLLHHLHGWSFSEIAARLGIGAGAAKLRSSRATTALRAFLSGSGSAAPSSTPVATPASAGDTTVGARPDAIDEPRSAFTSEPADE